MSVSTCTTSGDRLRLAEAAASSDAVRSPLPGRQQVQLPRGNDHLDDAREVRRRRAEGLPCAGDDGAAERSGPGDADHRADPERDQPAKCERALPGRLTPDQATRQGALALGRLVPFGIGAVIGVTGARALGRTVVTGARQAFGPPPTHFPRIIEVVAAARDLDLLP